MANEALMTEEEVRAILLQYIQTAGIGEMVLSDQIKKAFPNESRLPLKTLKRFLDGGIHTNDHTVELCRKFAAQISSDEA